MIMLCERCYTPVDDGEAFVSLAQIVGADRRGNITWIHTHVHTAGCVMPRLAPHERPDTGAWDPARRIGSRRL